jgi:hypothetical protein
MKLAPSGFLLALFLGALAGCSTGGPGEITSPIPEQQGQGQTGSGNTPTTGDTKNGTSQTPASTSTATGGGSLGPQCTAYIACCDQAAASHPEIASTCSSVKSSLEKAAGQAASLETSCKSGLDAYKSAGYCE